MSDTPPPQDPPTATSPAADATPPPANPPADEFDKDRALSTIRAQREEEKRLKAELAEAKKAQDRLAELEAAQLSDQEKAVKRAEEAEAKAAAADKALRTGYLLAELSKPEHGIVDAGAAAALITDVQYDDDGRPTNAKDRIAALLEAKGFLKATPSATPPPPAAPNIDAASGTHSAPGPALTADEIAAAQRIGWSPEKYAAWKDASTPADAARIAAGQT